MNSIIQWLKDNKENLIKRLKSLLWRAFCMVGVYLINGLLAMFTDMSVSPLILTPLGLLAGEATKWLNNHTGMFGAKLK